MNFLTTRPREVVTICEIVDHDDAPIEIETDWVLTGFSPPTTWLNSVRRDKAKTVRRRRWISR
jgi:hypothetical protein